ncbi:MAG: hypothetical protein FJZ92_14045, partial [Chloroflexi bacterium]|nr:hypothetical protein [Chloroflexota bacterium]
YVATRFRGGTPGQLVARRVSGPLPEDPADVAWRREPAVTVPLLPQQMTTPSLQQASIEQVQVRVLHNDQEIAFMVEWADQAVNEIEAVSRFRDAVAVQLPVNADPPPLITMGAKDQPVHILHWKASWQADVDRGQLTVKDAFPNAFNDVYPESVMGEAAAKVFYPALYVGNPMAKREKKSSVEELVAEGFGTLTHQEQQRAKGRAAFVSGRWRVVITVPMKATDTNQATITPGTPTNVAFAAWDGAKKNRGARKHWSNWVALEVEGTA